tara:strand:- start:248 stop:772 length:525 start_codon:yes stop_codon:yes gene_type:complete
MSETNAIETLRSGIEQLVKEVDQQFNQLNDVEKQLYDVRTIVNNFVSQTFQVVSDNPDMQSVNETLVNSLAQIKDFTTNRPNDVAITRMKIEQRKVAYEQCLILLDEVSSNIVKENSEQAEVDEEKKRRIMKGIDEETGEYSSRRKIGGRPERLKDIRNVEAELKSQKNLEEDN